MTSVTLANNAKIKVKNNVCCKNSKENIIDIDTYTEHVRKSDVYFDCYPHAWSRTVYTIRPPFPYMRASYYAIRERVPRNSKGAKAQGISLSNMTGHGRPTHPFFVRTRTIRTTLSHRLLISKIFSMIFIHILLTLLLVFDHFYRNDQTSFEQIKKIDILFLIIF